MPSLSSSVLVVDSTVAQKKAKLKRLRGILEHMEGRYKEKFVSRGRGCDVEQGELVISEQEIDPQRLKVGSGKTEKNVKGAKPKASVTKGKKKSKKVFDEWEDEEEEEEIYDDSSESDYESKPKRQKKSSQKSK